MFGGRKWWLKFCRTRSERRDALKINLTPERFSGSLCSDMRTETRKVRSFENRFPIQRVINVLDK